MEEAICLYNNHNAPNPYCSCGYYSIKKFGVKGRHYWYFLTTVQKNISRFSTNVIIHYKQLYTEQQKSFAELFFFYSPVVKTLEIKNFPILSEVALSGKVIECEKGYRSQKIEPKKFFYLVNFFELNGYLSEQLGNYINKDEAAEAIHATIVWLDFLNNYFKRIAKYMDVSFEILVNV